MDKGHAIKPRTVAQESSEISKEACRVQRLAQNVQRNTEHKMEDHVEKTPASVTKYSSARRGTNYTV